MAKIMMVLVNLVIAMMATMTMMICIMTEALLGWCPQGNAHKSLAPPSSLDHTQHHDHLSDHLYDDKIVICQSSESFNNIWKEKFQIGPVSIHLSNCYHFDNCFAGCFCQEHPA